jgi:hypothetical protein
MAMHEISFLEPEEDDYLLLHIWSALTIGLSAGLIKEAIPYTYFDTALPDADRKRIMAFYRRCVQRHLYADRRQDGNGARVYLAKNPALSPKVGSLFEAFPGAKVIYLARSPLEMIPSYLSMMRFSWRALGIPGNDRALRDYIVDMAAHWYRYPPSRLEQSPEDCYVIVRYEDLVKDPGRTVSTIYSRFGFDISPSFKRILKEEALKAQSFQTRHHYSQQELGLSRRQIMEQYADIFEQFGFDIP